MTATSEEVAAVAARGMTKPLTRAEQKMVCASALNQREFEANGRKISAAYKALGKLLADDKQLQKLERLGALLFPAKP